MNLQPLSGTEFRFVCFRCNRLTRSTGLPIDRGDFYEGPPMADLYGPSFRAYYCGKCAKEISTDSRSESSQARNSGPIKLFR